MHKRVRWHRYLVAIGEMRNRTNRQKWFNYMEVADA
jgi:hypothetical protein